MTISIALATYNGARHLRNQLESLESQTRPPDELVVSDDGSSDGTQEIVRSFARAAQFEVKLIEQPTRLGFADNFFAAAFACSSRYLAFCDQDDVWLPQKLLFAEKTLKARGLGIFVHQSCTVDESLNRLGQLDQAIPLRGDIRPLRFDAYDRGYGHCMVFRREILHVGNAARRPPQPRGRGRLSHDHFVMQMGALFSTVHIDDSEMTLYRQHEGNVFGAGASTTTALGDYSRPALADYRSQLTFYDQLLAYLDEDTAAAAASALGSQVSGAEVRHELKARVDRLRSRIESYTLTTLSERTIALTRSLRAGLASQSLRPRDLILSAGKDAVFGVLAKRSTTR